MKFRHEYKYDINIADFYILKQRLNAVLNLDDNVKDGHYTIRSLYFDNVYDKALREKIDGCNYREKYRIRYYNDDISFIRLEKKSKINGLTNKISEQMTANEVEELLQGNYEWMQNPGRPLVYELYLKLKKEGLRPKNIVEYKRIPYVYAPGNVRITLDYNLRVGMRCTEFLKSDALTLPIDKVGYALLEVKWDEYLPDIVRSAIQLGNRRENAFSKYAACRIYG